MRNIKITLEYDGRRYAGWQIQPKNQTAKRQTIQESIEKTLQKILQEKIKVIGSGRTDAGVHALAQVANFKTHSKIPLEKLQKALNALLPEDMVVNKIEEVGPDFHARFQAKSKLYRYTILNRRYPSVFLRHYAYFYPYPLDVNLMRKEAQYLVGRHNFKSFYTSDKKIRNPVRTIKYIKIKNNKGLITIDIEADGFLYNMARNIVGTLLEIGRGRFPQGSMKKILLAKDRTKAGPTVPAGGLCLIRVNY
ncbi:MAG: tRNA pseudouridine(38-40) synthase TruA [Candidatus Omnitrophica bacterium]|nr:tRNA pseudouridine(38-40) synthase TruA [Candidatus Omnitrophota bacterium]MCM8770369.1 tRNA pseudouridine(38-40) synthase TruA [Candidatus Omnitrophota bacterium]